MPINGCVLVLKEKILKVNLNLVRKSPEPGSPGNYSGDRESKDKRSKGRERIYVCRLEAIHLANVSATSTCLIWTILSPPLQKNTLSTLNYVRYRKKFRSTPFRRPKSMSTHANLATSQLEMEIGMKTKTTFPIWTETENRDQSRGFA